MSFWMCNKYLCNFDIKWQVRELLSVPISTVSRVQIVLDFGTLDKESGSVIVRVVVWTFESSSCFKSLLCNPKSNVKFQHNLHMWRVSVNILNKQSLTVDKGWSSSLGIGLVTKCYAVPRNLTEGPVAGSCEHGKEPSCSIKGGEFPG
jgi:hypothetical protein